MNRIKRSIIALAVIGLTASGAYATSSASADGLPEAPAVRQQARPLTGLMIASSWNNRCLEVRDGNPGNGVLVDMWDCGGWPSERWVWSGDQLRSDVGDKCLDVAGSNGSNGAAVNMFTCLGTNQQRWYWSGDQLRNKINDKCLTIGGSNWWSGASVVMWDCNGAPDQQRWHLV